MRLDRLFPTPVNQIEPVRSCLYMSPDDLCRKTRFQFSVAKLACLHIKTTRLEELMWAGSSKWRPMLECCRSYSHTLLPPAWVSTRNFYRIPRITMTSFTYFRIDKTWIVSDIAWTENHNIQGLRFKYTISYRQNSVSMGLITYIFTKLEFPIHNFEFHLLTTSANAKYYY